MFQLSKKLTTLLNVDVDSDGRIQDALSDNILNSFIICTSQ